MCFKSGFGHSFFYFYIMVIIFSTSVIALALVVLGYIYTKHKFKPKQLIKIPLVNKGVPTGTWVECYEGDSTYQKLKTVYGIIPNQIEVESLDKQ